jgi:hypothetical protein
LRDGLVADRGDDAVDDLRPHREREGDACDDQNGASRQIG